MAHCAINTGPDTHLLDHIAPLASLKNIPLLIDDEECFALAQKYYPEVSLRYVPDLEFQFRKLTEEFDTLYESKFWTPQIAELFQSTYGKKMHLIFCPHGQSDKGYLSPLLAPYALQDEVLLYGNLMKEMLIELNVWPTIKKHTFVGNYRLEYFKTHKQPLPFTLPKNKTLLYAPTWRDADEATTFFSTAKKLLADLPPHWNLILKLHPLLEQRDPSLFYRIAALQEKKPNFFLLDKYPPVYPLLELIDAYLGDYSSVGYDVLAFEKPMFFLKSDHMPPARLHSCGTFIDPTKNIFETIESNLHLDYTSTQKTLYEQAFTHE